MLIGIFGTGRNGSTLLMRLLDGIPYTYMHPIEINFLGAMNDLASGGRIKRSTSLNATLDPLLFLDKRIHTDLLAKYYGSHEEEISSVYITKVEDPPALGRLPFDQLREKPEYLPEDFVSSFLSAMAKWTNDNKPSKHFAFKTIETPYIEDYEDRFPDMKFIHIIRNPLDMYSSSKRTFMYYKSCPSWYLCGDNLSSVLDKRWIPHAKAILAKCPSDRHFSIRYEDLIQEPEKSIRDICDWLGLPLPLSPTQQTALGGKFMKKLPKNSSKKGVETPLSVVSNLSKKLGYDEVLTKKEEEFIVYKTFSYCRKLGYFQDIEMPDAGALAREWAWFDKWEFEHSKSVYGLLKSFFYSLRRRYAVYRAILS